MCFNLNLNISTAPITVIIILSLFFVYRAVLTSVFYKNAASKSDLILNKKYIFIPLVFGFFGVIIYCCAAKEICNKKQLLIKNFIIFIIVLFIDCLLIPFGIYENQVHLYNSDAVHSSKVVFKNSDKEYVYYDKLGNEYSVTSSSFDYDGIDYSFRYFDENDEPFLFDYNIENNKDYPKYISDETGEIVLAEDAYVDSYGNFVKINYDEVEEHNLENGIFVYLYNGKYYFNPYDCSWDKNGNLIFKDEELSDFYDDYS